MLLNPRRRLAYFKRVWKSEWIQLALDAVTQLYKDDYEGRGAAIAVPATPGRDAEPSEYDKWEESMAIDPIKDELQYFINSPQTPVNDPLLWWQEPAQQAQYPSLSRMAIDILSIHCMSADSERVFSGGRRTVSWDRASLGATTIEHTECLKSWGLSGLLSEIQLIEDDGVIDDDDDDGESP